MRRRLEEASNRGEETLVGLYEMAPYRIPTTLHGSDTLNYELVYELVYLSAYSHYAEIGDWRTL